jgi:uncharacterized sulfatase
MAQLLLAAVGCAAPASRAGPSPAPRPNILWIVAEDMSPDLGGYGEPYARTPELDRFAAQGVRFDACFTHAPVCAPSRSGLITGRYPTAIGTHHMRSRLLRPPPTFTRLLRDAGYFVAWPGKTDFNFDPPADAFDSVKAWTDRAPGKPFFAYVNITTSHESQIRAPDADFARQTARLRPDQRHDPAAAVLPPYYPDHPDIRRDWARYHDLVTAVDYRAGEVLAELERRGEAENTIVFFFGDHGRGLPRGKRWVYDSGLRVPLLVRWPGQLPAGTSRGDLVSFVDFAPTVLALAGAEVPADLPGRVFLGPAAGPPRRHVFAARDRMDETYDRIRCVRTERWKYIRNYHPELPYAQKVAYMELMPTMRAWRGLAAAGALSGPPALFFAPRKPPEELYDLAADPHEVRNLAGAPEHAAARAELRQALDGWIAETGDLGAVPETELIRRGLVADKLAEYRNRVVK